MVYALTIVAVVGLFVPSLMAVKGFAYRGVYFAVALAGLLLAFLAMQILDAPYIPSTEDEADALAAIEIYGPRLAAVFGAFGIGALFAAVLYKPGRP